MAEKQQEQRAFYQLSFASLRRSGFVHGGTSSEIKAWRPGSTLITHVFPNENSLVHLEGLRCYREGFLRGRLSRYNSVNPNHSHMPIQAAHWLETGHNNYIQVHIPTNVQLDGKLTVDRGIEVVTISSSLICKAYRKVIDRYKLVYANYDMPFSSTVISDKVDLTGVMYVCYGPWQINWNIL